MSLDIPFSRYLTLAMSYKWVKIIGKKRNCDSQGEIKPENQVTEIGSGS
jgi:hypothetical protein